MLRPAIEAVYDVFGGYPLREWTEPCAHCLTADDERKLRRAPLRELTAEDLQQYVCDSLMLWGNLDDLKHFLPRILEIAATEGFDFPDVEVVYGHLAYGAFATWPAREQAAVRDLALAHFQAALAEDVGPGYFEPVLSGIMLIEDDLTPYLAHWERAGDATTLANLAEYAREVGRIRAGEREWNAYLAVDKPDGPYGTARPGPAQVVEWLTGAALAARLGARRGTLPGPAVEAALEQVLRAIGDGRRPPG